MLPPVETLGKNGVGFASVDEEVTTDGPMASDSSSVSTIGR